MTHNVMSENIKYLPDVRSEMSHADFWTDEDELLMTQEEIEAQNTLTISTKETYMYDLKNQPEVVNTIELNKALRTSSKADADYYLGWTYLESDKKAKEAEFNKMINNTQNLQRKEKYEVKYGVATRRTNLHTFPSDTAIWDDPKDPECNYQYLASVRVNEPLVITSVSKDRKFYLAKSVCCSGWVPAEDVAICKDKEEWLSAWDIPKEKVLVVYGDEVYTEMSVTGRETSEVLMTMGTVLELADVENPNELIDNRSAYQNYVVYMPVRNPDGSYTKKLTLIPENEKVNIGYLPMTKNNIVSVALEALGNTYGWGNWLNSDDCSGYIRNIYKCFGLELARNTTLQSAMPMAKIDMKDMCR
ncbi:MAG: SH3 domain-containing protein, partial [Clostridia bacterium]|nr:SH3 domain-containing protein [Clostridia bacterium]